VLGLSVGTAQAAIVPELTGSFSGSSDFGGSSGASFLLFPCSTFGDPGGGFPLGAGVEVIPPNIQTINFSVSHSQTSVTVSNAPGQFCNSQFSGTTDGPITGGISGGTLNGLEFTGTVTGGTYSAESSFTPFGELALPFLAWGGSFDAPFKGFWSNGWYSTGDLKGVLDISVGHFVDASSSLNITTVTSAEVIPEPSTFMMLGAGLLPVIGVIRRRYLNR